jgi:hypothetical protein
MGLEVQLFCCHVLADGAIHTIPIQYGEGRLIQRSSGCDQLFGEAGAFEKTERRPRVKFNVHYSPV